MENITYLATPLLMISGLPQMFKLLRRKTAEDISRLTYSMTTIAIILLFLRSLAIQDLSLILANGSSMLITGTNTLLIFYYHLNDKNSRKRESDAPGQTMRQNFRRYLG